MKDYINTISVAFLFSFILFQDFENYSNKIEYSSDKIKIYVSYQNIKINNKQQTNLKLLIRKGNLEVVDLGTYDGTFSADQAHNRNQENLPENFSINSVGVINTFKIFRKYNSIILMRITKELSSNKSYRTVLKNISVGKSQVQILNPVQLKENPKAL
jgi:hypothetical protein